MNYRTTFLLQLSLVCFLFLANLSNSYASHLVGCTITYTCLGNNQYQFTMTCFQDCSTGTSLGTTASLSLSNTCGQGTPTSVMLNSIPAQSQVDVSQLCNPTTSSCQGGTQQGTEQWTYTGVTTLAPNCDWTVSYSVCCRSAAVSNLQNPSIEENYVSAFINTSANFCNSSVQFSNPPILYTCDSSLTYFNHGAYDPDGDSLIFTLVAPLTLGGTPISYVAGLSANSPVALVPSTTFLFDPSTGQMTFRPEDNTAQVAMIAVRIDEIRNGVVIASTIREVQIVVLGNCNGNGSPTVELSTFQGVALGLNETNLELCRGNFAEFELLIVDPNGDSLSVSSNIALAIPNGITNYTTNSIARDSVLLKFTVNSSSLMAGVYPFAINISDNACPIPTTQFLGYALTVLGASYGNTSFCKNTSNPTPIIYGDSTGVFKELLTNPLGLVLDSITGVVDIAASAIGTYGIIYRVDSTAVCPSDTITLSIVAGADASFSYASMICKQSITALPVVTGTLGGVFYSYTLGTALNSATGAINLAASTIGLHTIHYRVDIGCVDQDSFVINIMDLKAFRTTTNKLLHCSNNNDTMQLGTVVAYEGAAPTGATYTWTPNLNISNPNIFNPQVYVLGATTYYLDYNDGVCPTQRDSLLLSTPYDIVLSTTADTSICYGDTTSIGASVPLGTGTQTFASTGVSTLFVEDTTFLTMNILGISSATIDNALIGAMQLCMTLNVGSIGNLKVFLKSPNGQQVQITNRHGGLGTSLVNAIFSIDPTNLNLAAYAGPFPVMPVNSSFLPVGGTAGFNGLLGATTNGVWTLMIVHNNSGLSTQNGTVLNWCLNFRDFSPTTFLWTPSNAILSCATCDTAIVNPTTTTNYSVIATNLFGCKDTASVNVQVAPAINFTTTVSAVSCIGCADGTATANVLSTGTFDYLWSDGQTTATATGLDVGQYCVIISESGCMADTCIQILLDTLTNNHYYNNLNDELTFSIIENPITTNIVSLMINSSKEQQASIHIYTIDSKELLSLHHQSIQMGKTLIEIPIDKLTNGLYNIVLRVDEKILNQKLIIQR